MMDAILGAALDALGATGGCRRIPHPMGLDRGTSTYRAGYWKIKTMAAPALRLHHETCVYQARERHGLCGSIRHGSLGEGRWLAAPWEPGPTLWDALAPARCGNGSRTSSGLLLRTALNCFAELRRWRGEEWLHGDLQPWNIIVGDRTVFVDFEFTQHPRLPLPYAYEGGVAETTAPEVASQLIHPGKGATLGPEAEAYALGASIRWAWTGFPPAGLREPGDAGRTRLLRDIAHGRQRDLREDRPYPFPDLEELIELAIRRDPNRRIQR
jgi:hypothetical protein